MFTILEYFLTVYAVLISCAAAYVYGLMRRLATENTLNQVLASLQQLFGQITFHPQIAQQLRQLGFNVREEQVVEVDELEIRKENI